MSLDTVLSMIGQLGLAVKVDPDGTPRLSGPADVARQPEVMAALKLYRAEIVERLRPKPTRRIVLLRDGRDSEVDRVLWEGVAGQEHGRIRDMGKAHVGRMLATEWLGTTPTGNPKWTRYVWCKWETPREEIGS